MIGIHNRQEVYAADMASYYDLIVGLHPDQATKEIAYSAHTRPVLLIPCCNFWSEDEKLGTIALIEAIENYYKENNILFERVIFDFERPKNIGIVSLPPR